MKNETIKTSAKIGATVGGLTFLTLGIMPGIHFGGFGTLILLQKLMGGSVDPTLLVRMVMVMGIMVGLTCAAAVCLVVGGLMGTLAGYVVSAPKTLISGVKA